MREIVASYERVLGVLLCGLAGPLGADRCIGVGIEDISCLRGLFETYKRIKKGIHKELFLFVAMVAGLDRLS